MNATRMLAVNELGIRVGEDHQGAKLTNAEVDRLLELHEEQQVGYKRLADLFAVSVRTVRNICNYERRAQHAVDFRRGDAPTIEQRRVLSPATMGPVSCECIGCFQQTPYREMQVLGGYRWCEPCYARALRYAKNAKKRKNMQENQLFTQEIAQ